MQADSICQEKVFKAVFYEHAKSLRDYLYYKSGDLAQAEDLVQDAFSKLWENCAKVSVAKARSFLFVTANNRFLNLVNRKKVAFKFEQKFAPGHENQDPEFLLESKEFKERLESAIAALPDDQRQIFLMNRLDKLKYREIAEIKNISIKTVEKKMQLALSALRKIHKKV